MLKTCTLTASITLLELILLFKAGFFFLYFQNAENLHL